jgi:hypothetical protein
MATPADKLAQSLAALKALQDAKAVAIRATDLTRVHRERLLKNGFIREVMKGWYIPVRPDGPAGESTDWYASFWPFCAAYLSERFGEDWCLGAEHSIALHTGNWNVPRQLLVRATRGGNKPTGLLHDTSIFDMRLPGTFRPWTACASCVCPPRSLPAHRVTSPHNRSRCAPRSP